MDRILVADVIIKSPGIPEKTPLMKAIREKGLKVIEASKEIQDQWVAHHDEIANKTLVVKTDSWYMGSNVDGKPRRLLSYIGGVGNYHAKCDELARTATGKLQKFKLREPFWVDVPRQVN